MTTRIINIVGWIGTALVFAAVAVRLLRPEWNQYATYAAWAGLALVLVYMGGQWRDIVEFYRRRSAQYGTMAFVGVAVFLGILVAVNYLAVRRNKRWDFTANQVYSLSDQSVKVVQNLDAPVKFTVFDRETNFDRFRERLTEYTYHSKQVSVDYVDPDREPSRAKAAQIQSYGTILIEYKDRSERVTVSGEQEITNGLIKAITGEQRKVYFTQGHGEKDTTSAERTGYTAVAQALGGDNYTVERLVLAQQQKVPDDATVVVIAGPRTDLLQPEIDALTAYLNRGGKLLALVDPPDDAKAPAQPLLAGLLHDWGMQLGDNVVLDASGIGRLIGTDASVPVVAQYPTHPATEALRGIMTAFPFARSVAPVDGGVNGRTAQRVLETSAQSWAEKDTASLATGKVTFDASRGDTQGPIALGAAVSMPAPDAPPAPAPGNQTPLAPDAEKKPETRVLAIGDSDFAANFALGIQGNRDLFLNAVSWLAEQENLVAIRAREPEDRRITLTSAQQNNLALLSIVVIPALVFASGVYSWWRRR